MVDDHLYKINALLHWYSFEHKGLEKPMGMKHFVSEVAPHIPKIYSNTQEVRDLFSSLTGISYESFEYDYIPLKRVEKLNLIQERRQRLALAIEHVLDHTRMSKRQLAIKLGATYVNPTQYINQILNCKLNTEDPETLLYKLRFRVLDREVRVSSRWVNEGILPVLIISEI